MFSVFVIDPPWPKRMAGSRKGRATLATELPYKTMSVDGIFMLLKHDLLEEATPDHSVFIWTIDDYLKICEERMEALGYKRHARIIWDKGNGFCPAFTVRFTHEYLIWYYKDKLPPVDEGMRGKLPTVIRAPSRQHSRKPDEAYDFVKSLYPTRRKLDVFSREAREGWSQYGHETDRFSK